jgi:hypothetical protein
MEEFSSHEISSSPNCQTDNLDHWVFDDSEGPVKCFSCSRMMEVKTVKGRVDSINSLGTFENKRYASLAEIRD